LIETISCSLKVKDWLPCKFSYKKILKGQLCPSYFMIVSPWYRVSPIAELEDGPTGTMRIDIWNFQMASIHTEL